MPTAPKLIAGLTLALVAAIASYVFAITHPELFGGTVFILSNALFGFLVGWFSFGQKPGRGFAEGATKGIRSGIVLVFISAVAFGLRYVVKGMKKGFFNEPMDVFITWLSQSADYLVMSFTPEVWAIILVGGAISGIVTQFSSRYWT